MLNSTTSSGKITAISVFLFLLTLLSCNNPGKRPVTEQEISKEQISSDPKKEGSGQALFDGESLRGWEITRFGPEGPVQVTDGKIVLGMGDGLTGITWTGEFPRMNYEVSLEAMKMTGNDFFCGITFPADTAYCSFIVGGWGGPVVGLSTIDGRDASENSTKLLMRFDKDVWYDIRLRVIPGKIEGWINDEKVVDFETEGHEIGIRPEVSLSKPFGIASWITTAALRNIRLTMLQQDAQSEAQIRASE